MTTLHQRRTHPTPIDGCFGCKVSTLRFNGSSEVMAVDQREKELSRNLGAYKRLRAEGMQPKRVRDAWDAEQRSDTKFEVEHPSLRNLPAEAKPFAAEAIQVATEIPQSISRFKDTP